MMSKSKGIINVMIFLSLLLLTIYAIFHGQNVDEFLNYLKQADIRYWFLSIVCVILFIGSESIIIFYMFHTIKQKVRLGHCFLYSFVGFFFSCITPSATGGQPAQIYFMKKDKIPIPVATLILIIVTITYKMVLVAIGIVVVMIHPAKIMQYMNPVLIWCYLGLALNIICISFMLLLVFYPAMAKWILTTIIKILHKIHLIKNKTKILDKMDNAIKQYQDIAYYFTTHKLVIINVFLITIFQRFILFYVTYLTYRSFGLHEAGFITIVTLQGLIALAVDMLPLPGGMGISEKLFLMIFTPVLGSIALPAMAVSRGLSYYTELIISALMTIVAHFIIGKEREYK